jgi:protein arginine N-methyltransferase 1
MTLLSLGKLVAIFIAHLSVAASFVLPHVPRASSLPRSSVPRAELSRRDLVGGAAASGMLLVSAPALAETAVLSSAWTSTEGFNLTTFIEFNEDAYKAMRDDESRTPLFEKAIRERLAGTEGMVVVDIGTGPYALFALAAARAGAKKVYAIEVKPPLAKSARQVVKKEGFSNVIQVIEGFSTQVELPEKADLCVSEIVGSVASEEGIYGTIKDAHARFLKRPDSPASWIPTRVQTVAAPATFALQYVLGPPEYDWGRYLEPIRFNCRDETVTLLADPQILEDIDLADPNLPAAGTKLDLPSLSFTISPERIKANENTYYVELLKELISNTEARKLAVNVSHSLSGLAMWPRLVLDEKGEIIVNSRGPKGEPRKSHWQTVLSLMTARPQTVDGGDKVNIQASVDVTQTDVPMFYSLDGDILRGQARTATT